MGKIFLILSLMLISCQQPRQERYYNNQGGGYYDNSEDNNNSNQNSNQNSLEIPSAASHCNWDSYSEASPLYGSFNYCKSQSNSNTFYFRFKNDLHLCFYFLNNTNTSNEIYISERKCHDFVDDRIYKVDFELLSNKDVDGIMIMEYRESTYDISGFGTASVYHHTIYEACYRCLNDRWRSGPCADCEQFKNKGQYHKLAL